MDATGADAFRARSAGQTLGAGYRCDDQAAVWAPGRCRTGLQPGQAQRPSHGLHTFWVGNLRLVLDVQVSSGKQHTSVHVKAALVRLLDELGDKRPAMVRGDSGYGNEGMLLELEGRGQS